MEIALGITVQRRTFLHRERMFLSILIESQTGLHSLNCDPILVTTPLVVSPACPASGNSDNIVLASFAYFYLNRRQKHVNADRDPPSLACGSSFTVACLLSPFAVVPLSLSIFSFSLLICMYTSLLHSAHLSASRVTDAPQATLWVQRLESLRKSAVQLRHYHRSR